MTTLIIKSNQEPPKETIDRLLELKDEDIVYDNDCPKLTPKMEDALKKVILQNRIKKAT